MWTDPEDVIDSWIGEDVPGDVELVRIWVAKAEREIRFRIPNLQDRIDAEAQLVPSVTDLIDTARDVVAAMVTRKFDNPRNVRQRNVTTGPFTSSETMGGDVPGDFSMTESELAKLQGVRSRGAFTVSLIPETSPFFASPPFGGWYAPGE